VSAKGIPKEEKGWIMPLVQLGREKEDRARKLRDQKDDLQATLTKMHLKKMSLLQFCREARKTPNVRWRRWFLIWL
jgi:hypothetical protein